jgi:cytochrome c556
MRKLLILLFITMTGCLSVACHATGSEAPAPDASSAFTIREVMQSMVAPQADSLWNAVSTSVTEKGVETKAPSNDEEWATMRHAAVTLSEAMNIVVMPGRKVAKAGEQAKDPKIELEPEQIDALIAQDRATFAKYAHDMQDSVAQAVKAIDAKSADGLSTAGAAIDAACETCHKKYWYPNDEKAQEQK